MIANHVVGAKLCGFMGDKSASRTYSSFHQGVVKPSRHKDAEPAPASPTHPGHFMALAALLGLVLLGGGRFVWVQGAFLAVIGLLILVRPPSSTLDTKLDWTTGLLMLIAALAFLPSGLLEFLPSFLFGRPAWWHEASKAGVELPITSSSQPLKSLEGFLLLFAGISYLYLLINCRLRMDDRWRLLQGFVLLGGVLAGVVVYGNLADLQYFWTDYAASFSFFDNRNQTSALLMMIGIVSLAMAFYAVYKHWIWMLVSALAFLACAFGVSMSLSRSGLLLFVIGCGVWIIMRFTVLGDRGLMRFVAPLVAVSFSLMLITGQETFSRLSSWFGGDDGMFSDFRWSIYRDAISMVAAQPFTGVGLGNFAEIFPFFREHSISANPALHPESDWMWIAVEMGVPGFSIMATLVCFLFWMCIPFGDERLSPVRMAALIAGSMFLVHTFFDVSGHQLGVILIAIWIFRMGMPQVKIEPACLAPAWLWRMGGVILLIAGVTWIGADLTRTMLHSEIAKEEAFIRVTEAMETEEAEGLVDDLDTSLTFLPMDWELYLQRGQARLYLQNDTNGARKDFLRARVIEPILVAPALYEGQVWLPRSTHYAYEAWADALTREAENPNWLFHLIIKDAEKNPRFSRELDQLSQTSPEFRTFYLQKLKGDKFLQAITDTLRRDPKLQTFTPDQREAILKRWMNHGDAGRLIRYLETNEDATDNAWYYHASALARLGNYPGAIELAGRYIPVPQIPVMESMTRGDIKEQRAIFASQPTDVVRGGALLQTQINQQDVEGALWTIERLLKLKDPPPYAYYWLGELHRLKGNHAQAWKEGWKIYLTEVIERKMELKSAEQEMFEDLPDESKGPVLWDKINQF